MQSSIDLIDVVDVLLFFFFFFQAEDGIRDWSVTGVQTCALPICMSAVCGYGNERLGGSAIVNLSLAAAGGGGEHPKIGRASCRERV